jgi:peroxiredoxin
MVINFAMAEKHEAEPGPDVGTEPDPAGEERADQGAEKQAGPEPTPEEIRPPTGRSRRAARQRGKATGRVRPGASERERATWPRKIGSWVLQLAVVAVAFWGITRWQARRLLADATPAPAFTLQALDGSSHSLPDAQGRAVVLYFFAPWCTVCSYSSHNINALRQARSDEELAIYAVGLEWEESAELERFAKEHELAVPVLRGDDDLRRAYRVDTFPTVYVIDERGAVQDRVVGYTTELGLRLRSL